MLFHSPIALLLLLLSPFLIDSSLRQRLFPFNADSNDDSVFLFSSTVPLEHTVTSVRARLRAPLISLLRVLTFSLLVIALARPQFGARFVNVKIKGRDIMLALDVSESMMAVDFESEGGRIDRLTALKNVVKQFIDHRPGDRIGLVVFGTEAFTQCPLTRDHGVLKDLIDSLEVGMAGESTAIGKGLAISLKRMKTVESDSRVIVLVTDGRNNSQTLHPYLPANIAHEKNIKIHTVGIGGTQPAPFQVSDMFGHQDLEYRRVYFDERTLKDISEITDGVYFNAQNMDQLSNVYKEINKLEERTEKSLEYVNYEERYLGLVGTALGLFLLLGLLELTVFLRVP